MPLAATVTVPCDGEPFAVTVNEEPASLLNTVVPVLGVLAVVTAVSLVAFGVTVRLTVAVEVCPLASVTV